LLLPLLPPLELGQQQRSSCCRVEPSQENVRTSFAVQGIMK